MDLRENTLFAGRYRLLRLLGRGGFSEVWLAVDEKTTLQVAVKVYASGSGLDEEGIRLFTEELSIVYNLNHSNLLKPQHFDECEGCPYLVLPYCERGSAQRLIGRITEEEAWRFLHDVAAGLEYLHAKEPPVIHRDIKPDNVLRDASGTFMITDFGISTRARSTLRRSVPHAEHSGGTMEYMGPERFGEKPAPIKASDIWSLGATLYELLTGSVPFVQLGGILQMNGALIPDIEGAWSGQLKEVIKTCLAKDPWDRPTAHVLREYVEAYWRGENPELKKSGEKPAPRIEEIPPVSKGKNWKWVGFFLLLLIGGGGVGYYFSRPAEPMNKIAGQSGTEGKDSLRLLEGGVKGAIESVGKPVTGRPEVSGEEGERNPNREEVREERPSLDIALNRIEKDREGVSNPNRIPAKRHSAKNGLTINWASSVTLGQKEVLSRLVENMVQVEGGSFDMGGTSEQGRDVYSDEKPVHRVRLSDYYIGKYEVCQSEWEAVMGSNPSFFKGNDLPVEEVSWTDCHAFIRKLNTLTGLHFKLPTEAQWEYAARGGNLSRGSKYSGSNDLGEVGWYGGNSGDRTHPVGQKRPNELGIYDMSGNVYEWCEDRYGDYSSNSQTDPVGAANGSDRVARGGSWSDGARLCRVSYRLSYVPGFRSFDLGFRLGL